MILKLGSTGNAVKEIQKALGLTADGNFGPYTEAAVKKYQSLNGLLVDGIVGTKTYEALCGKSNIDTDRFGYDDSNDTDGKLKLLGKYTTKDNLVIDRAYLDSDEYIREYGKIQPKSLFIHHTAGWNDPYKTVSSWNTDDRGRVGTQYCIGGKNIKTGDAQFDGQVVECFPNNYIGWHLGKVGNFDISKFSCGIEINNFGFAKKIGTKFFNYVNVEIPSTDVVDLGFEFRGYRYWHKYTNAQLKSLELLFKHIKTIYPKINFGAGLPDLLRKGVHPKDAFEFNLDAYNAKVHGIWSHTNVRKDKFDCFPQPELVEILKRM